MTTAAIRKKLISYIADADDKKVKGLYMLVEDDMPGAAHFKLSSDQMNIVEEERAQYMKGEGQSLSWEESKHLIRSRKKKS